MLTGCRGNWPDGGLPLRTEDAHIRGACQRPDEIGHSGSEHFESRQLKQRRIAVEYELRIAFDNAWFLAASRDFLTTVGPPWRSCVSNTVTAKPWLRSWVAAATRLDQRRTQRALIER